MSLAALNQIYSMRYGTIPVVRATGGLDDTVEPVRSPHLERDGFKFREYSGETMLETLRVAIKVYRGDQKAWKH